MDGFETPAAYWVGGRCIDASSPEFAEAIATAHAAHQRPLCLCVAGCVEMYVARLAGTSDRFIVKRMPDTGSMHAPGCPSYEPPAGASGLGQVLGSAVTEDPTTGATTLKLDFAMSKVAGRSVQPAPGAESDSVATKGTRLSLRGLLHFLWDQADLTRWRPGFEGKRSWSMVRRHLMQAAENKTTRGKPLLSRLYIPESFSVEHRDEINDRRVAQWMHATRTPGGAHHLLLLIAEVKEIAPARYGFKAVVKHVPDQAFTLDGLIYRRLGRRFEAELSLWAALDDVHMMMIATFSVGAGGVPSIHELSLMPATKQWIPIEDEFEKRLVDRLVADERCFVKGLRYNLESECLVASATLTDCGALAPQLFLVPVDKGLKASQLPAYSGSDAAWFWRRGMEAMPELPHPAGGARVSLGPL